MLYALWGMIHKDRSMLWGMIRKDRDMLLGMCNS
jgi:hypothetical protein